MVLILFALVGVNVYFLGLRGGTSIGALLRTTRVKSGGAAPTTPTQRPTLKAPPLPEDPPAARLVEGLLADGETIAHALTPHVGKRTAAQIEEAVAEKVDLGAVRAGQPFLLVWDADERLVAFEFRAAPTATYRVELTAKRPTLALLEGRAETRTAELVLPAGPSIWEALRRQGESPQLGEIVCELFAGEGDLCGAGASSGERVRLVVERRLLGGRLHRYGRVLGAEWMTRTGARRAFWFNGAQPGYYTERGEAVARATRMTPFRPSRGVVTGRFEIQHAADAKVHVEHAAPTGSAGAIACAIVAGQVTAITRAPAGVTLAIQAADGGRVTYTHLGRLARGLSLGQRVEVGQALGHADAGLLLTYEGDALVRAIGLPGPRQGALTAAERPRFGETIAPMLERLRTVALRPTDPLAARALSAIP